MHHRTLLAAATTAIAVLPLTARAQDEQPAPDPALAEPVQEEKGFFGRWTSGWEGGISVGLNGSSGNTENFNLRAGIDGTRKTETTASRFDIIYTYGESEGATNKNYFSTAIRNDWILENSRWRPYLRGSIESDQFQDWRWRTGTYAGAGYAFIDNEKTTFIGRVGAGARYEFTGEKRGWTPEGNLGLDLIHQLTQRQQILATVDYYPSLDRITDYRVDAKGEWSILLDEETNLSLKIGVENRFNSTAGDGFKKNDFDYFALLSWAY